MLPQTFCHAPGLGAGTERKLWDAGLHTWEAAADCERLPLSANRSETLRALLRESLDQLAAGSAHYFYDLLPSREHWRLFPHFRDSIAYLDIETTGLGSPGDIITTIVLYDGRHVYSFVQGDNLADFADRVARYKLLVTYNGKSFDLPFIRSYLNIPVDQAHIDLRYVLGSLGYRGGLKGCERQLGLYRGDLEEVDGFFAVLLWREFQASQDPRVLETLLAYNALDTIDLEPLMVLAYNEKLRQTPFAENCLDLPREPENPFRANVDIIRKIKRSYGWI